jgi:hypothetical protein
MIDPIKVGVGLSGTIASHKTLTLVVGMTMILDDFLSQCMLQNNSRTASVTGELQSQVPVTWLSLHFWWKMTFNPSLKIRRFTINSYRYVQRDKHPFYRPFCWPRNYADFECDNEAEPLVTSHAPTQSIAVGSSVVAPKRCTGHNL